MTGVTLPASSSSRILCRTSCRGLELSIRRRWLTNRDSATARRLRSNPPNHRPLPSLPTITSVPFGGKGPPQLGQGTVARGVHDQIPVARPVGDIPAGVVDHAVGADRADQLDLGGGAHTPVTWAPNALASWTANDPTPPAAPMTSTSCPAWTWPTSRSAWRAAKPEMGTAAACATERFDGFGRSSPRGRRRTRRRSRRRSSRTPRRPAGTGSRCCLPPRRSRPGPCPERGPWPAQLEGWDDDADQIWQAGHDMATPCSVPP
jgi:hypothetical protein